MKNKKILLVDDEADVTTALTCALEVYGFEVDSYNNPLAALSSFKSNYYDIAILDIKMPKMDGFVLYERLKTIEPDVKVCFLTASEMYHEEIRKEKYSVLDNELFIQKPISTDDLIRKINNKINSK
jgi:DNA-binding response OmpR family regulator